MATRDPKTGRFLPKEKVEAAKAQPAKTVKAKPAKKAAPAKPAKAAPKTKKAKAAEALEIGVKIQKVLETPMEIFIKKDLSGKAKHILPGSSVFIEKTEAIGPTGSNLIRVKRANCDRTYYTIAEKVNL